MEAVWLRESLFAGQGANAWKLGTVLSLGWFWQRPAGCSLLYRASSIEVIEVDDVLAAGDADAEEMIVPQWLSLQPDSSWVYLLRRVNGCGDMERTQTAAVRVRFDSQGELAAARPNGVFGLKAERISAGKVKLTWNYCPVEQESEPERFVVSIDGEAVGQVTYRGRGCYSFNIEALAEGTYSFHVWAEDEHGEQDALPAEVRVEICDAHVEAVRVLGVEVG